MGMDAGFHLHEGPNSIQVTIGPGLSFSLYSNDKWEIQTRVFTETLIGFDYGISLQGLYHFNYKSWYPGLGTDISLRYGEAIFHTQSLNYIYPMFPELTPSIVLSPLVFKKADLLFSALKTRIGTPISNGFGYIVILDVELISILLRVKKW